MENMKQNIPLKCGHLFHPKCIQDWVIEKEELICPVCK